MKLALVIVILSQLILVHAMADTRLAFSHRLRVATYPVLGSNPLELQQAMHLNGPVSHLGKRHFAYTLWHMRLGRDRYELMQETLRPSDFICNVSVHLPLARLESNDMREKWNRFFKNLIVHENIHIRQAIRVCNILKHTKVRPAMLKAFSSRLKLRDLKLDHLSQHGKLSGVFLD